MLLLGTNNSGMNTPGEIALGVATVVKYLREHLPRTKILLLAIFPSRAAENRARILKANTYLAELDDGKMVRYLDINANFLDKDGKLRGDMFADDVHLTRLSYFMWGTTTAPLLAEMMGD
jgi:beta-glucosidase